MHHIYTDGACSGNPGPGGWGVVSVTAQGSTLTISDGHPSTTNNQMELTAAIEGLKLIPEGEAVTLYSDSQYVTKGMTEWIDGWMARGWKTGGGDPVKNKELWKTLWGLTRARSVTWQWVKGHASNQFNNQADKLAVAARKRYEA